MSDLYFLSHNDSVYIILFNFKKKLLDREKDIGESVPKTVTLQKQRLNECFMSTSF